ncbi:MAG: hypothetical protein R2823_02420 [Acidimicrobiia bacterium]
MLRKQRTQLLIIAAVVSIVGASCSSDGGDTSTTTAPQSDSTTTTAQQATTTTASVQPDPADFNGDGVVRIGVATEGPRDDGAYYQALVEQVEAISAENGFEDPIIVDQIDAASSHQELENLAAQNVDIIAIGSSGLADGNEDLFLEFDEIFWYCNCGSGYQDTPGLLRSQDSGAELQLSAGYATGLLIDAAGGESAVFLGCCDLNFEVESYRAFEEGLKLANESITATYVPTGNFPFDFNNTAGATEAYNNAVAQGADAVNPFLGGAHEPIVALANEDGLITMTAGSSKGCERDDLDYDLEVMFDAGDYLVPIFNEILSGTAEEGGARIFRVGVDPEVGARFCDATPEQVQALDDFNKAIGAGEYDELIFSILSEAYEF